MNELYCLGDSLTYGLGVRVSQKWTTLAASDTLRVIPMGISGDTTGGILARMQSLSPCHHSAPSQRPFVLVMGGTNDIFFSGTDTGARANLGAMIHQLCAMGYRPLVGIPLPICPEDAPEKWRELANFETSAQLLEDYCHWLKAFCAAFDIPFVDFHEDYVNLDGSVRRELFLDGLHPNAAGHAQMAQRLKEALQ